MKKEEKKFHTTKNGGKLLRVEKGGESPNPAGKPKGTRNWKTLLNKLLDENITHVGDDGKQIKTTRRDLIALRAIKDAHTLADDTARLKAAALVMDRSEDKVGTNVNINPFANAKPEDAETPVNSNQINIIIVGEAGAAVTSEDELPDYD